MEPVDALLHLMIQGSRLSEILLSPHDCQVPSAGKITKRYVGGTPAPTYIWAWK